MVGQTRWNRRTVGIAIGATVLMIAVAALAMVLLTPAPSKTVQVKVTIAQDPTSGSYVYSPSFVQVPSGSIVQLTIWNYDPAVHAVDSVYCNVTGTMDGTMQEMSQRMGSMMGGPSEHGLNPTAVGHTFTMRSGGWNLNIPIPPAPSAGMPSIVQVSFQAHGTGTTSWTCEATMGGTLPPMMGSFESS